MPGALEDSCWEAGGGSRRGEVPAGMCPCTGAFKASGNSNGTEENLQPCWQLDARHSRVLGRCVCSQPSY
jgi:hypothetical protein